MSESDQPTSHRYATRSTGPPPEIKILKNKKSKKKEDKLITFSDDEMANPAQPGNQHVVQQQLNAGFGVGDIIVPLDHAIPDKRVSGVEVFNNQGYATYQHNIGFTKEDCHDATSIFTTMVRGRLALPFPAFPTDITRPNMNNHEFYIWFCQSSGLGYILDKENLSPEKVSSENAMRYGIGTLLSYKVTGITMYPLSTIDKVTFEILKSAYPSSIMTNDVWSKYSRGQKFSYLGTLFNHVFMTRTTMTVSQLMAYSYAKFCFTVIGKEPSRSTGGLIRSLTGGQADFFFTPTEIGVWADMTTISVEKQQELLSSLFARPTELTEVFKILYDRFKTYGLTSMITISEAIGKFSTFPWKAISDQWYSGELEAYMLALEATANLEFPALHKDILTRHSVMKYRKFAGFCAKVLEFSGTNLTLRNHEGLKRVRLPDDRVQYIKGLIASPLSSQNQGLDQATYDRLKNHTMRLCGISLDDPNIAAKRQEAINARIRQQEEEESQRMAQVFQRFQQQAIGQVPAQGPIQQQP